MILARCTKILGTKMLALALVSAAFITLGSVSAAQADASKQIGVFNRWTAYTFTEGNGTVCFAAAQPTKTLPAGVRRGEIYTMVTHRPAEKSRGVVSFVIGYTFKKDSAVTVTIGKQKFTLMTDGDTAWTRDAKDDVALVKALRDGSTMTVAGVSSRGTKTTDTYSLAGSTAAFKAIDGACP